MSTLYQHSGNSNVEKGTSESNGQTSPQSKRTQYVNQTPSFSKSKTLENMSRISRHQTGINTSHPQQHLDYEPFKRRFSQSPNIKQDTTLSLNISEVNAPDKISNKISLNASANVSENNASFSNITKTHERDIENSLIQIPSFGSHSILRANPNQPKGPEFSHEEDTQLKIHAQAHQPWHISSNASQLYQFSAQARAPNVFASHDYSKSLIKEQPSMTEQGQRRAKSLHEKVLHSKKKKRIPSRMKRKDFAEDIYFVNQQLYRSGYKNNDSRISCEDISSSKGRQCREENQMITLQIPPFAGKRAQNKAIARSQNKLDPEENTVAASSHSRSLSYSHYTANTKDMNQHFSSMAKGDESKALDSSSSNIFSNTKVSLYNPKNTYLSIKETYKNKQRDKNTHYSQPTYSKASLQYDGDDASKFSESFMKDASAISKDSHVSDWKSENRPSIEFQATIKKGGNLLLVPDNSRTMKKNYTDKEFIAPEISKKKKLNYDEEEAELVYGQAGNEENGLENTETKGVSDMQTTLKKTRDTLTAMKNKSTLKVEMSEGRELFKSDSDEKDPSLLSAKADGSAKLKAANQEKGSELKGRVIEGDENWGSEAPSRKGHQIRLFEQSDTQKFSLETSPQDEGTKSVQNRPNEALSSLKEIEEHDSDRITMNNSIKSFRFYNSDSNAGVDVKQRIFTDPFAYTGNSVIHDEEDVGEAFNNLKSDPDTKLDSREASECSPPKLDKSILPSTLTRNQILIEDSSPPTFPQEKREPSHKEDQHRWSSGSLLAKSSNTAADLKPILQNSWSQENAFSHAKNSEHKKNKSMPEERFTFNKAEKESSLVLPTGHGTRKLSVQDAFSGRGRKLEFGFDHDNSSASAKFSSKKKHQLTISIDSPQGQSSQSEFKSLPFKSSTPETGDAQQVATAPEHLMNLKRTEIGRGAATPDDEKKQKPLDNHYKENVNERKESLLEKGNAQIAKEIQDRIARLLQSKVQEQKDLEMSRMRMNQRMKQSVLLQISGWNPVSSESEPVQQVHDLDGKELRVVGSVNNNIPVNNEEMKHFRQNPPGTKCVEEKCEYIQAIPKNEEKQATAAPRIDQYKIERLKSAEIGGKVPPHSHQNFSSYPFNVKNSQKSISKEKTFIQNHAQNPYGFKPLDFSQTKIGIPYLDQINEVDSYDSSPNLFSTLRNGSAAGSSVIYQNNLSQSSILPDARGEQRKNALFHPADHSKEARSGPFTKERGSESEQPLKSDAFRDVRGENVHDSHRLGGRWERKEYMAISRDKESHLSQHLSNNSQLFKSSPNSSAGYKPTNKHLVKNAMADVFFPGLSNKEIIMKISKNLDNVKADSYIVLLGSGSKQQVTNFPLSEI